MRMRQQKCKFPHKKKCNNNKQIVATMEIAASCNKRQTNCQQSTVCRTWQVSQCIRATISCKSGVALPEFKQCCKRDLSHEISDNKLIRNIEMDTAVSIALFNDNDLLYQRKGCCYFGLYVLRCILFIHLQFKAQQRLLVSLQLLFLLLYCLLQLFAAAIVVFLSLKLLFDTCLAHTVPLIVLHCSLLLGA